MDTEDAPEDDTPGVPPLDNTVRPQVGEIAELLPDLAEDPPFRDSAGVLRLRTQPVEMQVGTRLRSCVPLAGGAPDECQLYEGAPIWVTYAVTQIVQLSSWHDVHLCAVDIQPRSYYPEGIGNGHWRYAWQQPDGRWRLRLEGRYTGKCQQ